MTPLRRILGMAGAFRGAFSGAALFYVLYTLVSLVSLGMIIPVLDVILSAGSSSPGEVAMPSMPTTASIQDWISHFVGRAVSKYGPLGTLGRVSVAAMGLFFLKNGFRYAALWNMSTLRTGISSMLRNALHEKLLHLAPATVHEKRKGDILARASNDVNEVEWAILTGLELLVREPLVILGSLIVLLAMSAKLTLILLIIGPLAAWLLQLVSKRLKRKSTLAQDRLGEVLSAIEESLSGLRILQAFQAESYQSSRFAQINERAFHATREVHRRRDLASPLSELIGVGALLLILFYGGREVLQGDGLTGPTLVAYLLFFYQLIPAFKSVSMALYNLQKGNAAAERLFAILDLPETLRDPEHTESWECPPHGPKTIEFRDIHYSYPGASHPALKGLHLHIGQGQTIALVGPSGGGKSTVVNLLLRAMDPDSGGIFIDGRPISACYKDPQDPQEIAQLPMPMKDLRSAMGLVTQDPILFQGTALENIALGDPKPNLERAKKAAQEAQAIGFIEDLPKGWDHIIAEGGQSLSGGQRQRMALARALYRNAPILLLDEATSALDAENERLVQEALEAASAGRTTLVVAHRLATVQKADRIIVLDQGKVVEEGDHRTLMANGGLYFTLVQTQQLET